MIVHLSNSACNSIMFALCVSRLCCQLNIGLVFILAGEFSFLMIIEWLFLSLIALFVINCISSDATTNTPSLFQLFSICLRCAITLKKLLSKRISNKYHIDTFFIESKDLCVFEDDNDAFTSIVIAHADLCWPLYFVILFYIMYFIQFLFPALPLN